MSVLHTASMSKTIKKQVVFLEALEKLSPIQRRLLLKHLTTDQVKVIIELVTNLLQPQFPLSKGYEVQLKKHKVFLRHISNPQVAVSEKKECIQKKGSVIVLIVKATLPFVRKHYAVP